MGPVSTGSLPEQRFPTAVMSVTYARLEHAAPRVLVSSEGLNRVQHPETEGREWGVEMGEVMLWFERGLKPAASLRHFTTPLSPWCP